MYFWTLQRVLSKKISINWHYFCHEKVSVDLFRAAPYMLTLVLHKDALFQLSWLEILGNCDINVERKILFMNETKWYKIWPRPKGWVQKIFWTFLPNFVKGLKESCHKFCLFCKSAKCKKWSTYLSKYPNKL